MKRTLLLLAISTLLLSACTKTPSTEDRNYQGEQKPSTVIDVSKDTSARAGTSADTKTTEGVKSEDPDSKTYTAAEVALHNKESDCWLIIEAKVYNVTKFIPSHPGWKAILNWCGKDATQMFSEHPERAREMKEKFYIGDLK